MNFDLIIVVIIVAFALGYSIYYFVKKVRRLSKNIGPCGHCCDNCPFAKYNRGFVCCHTKPGDNPNVNDDDKTHLNL